MVHKHIVALEDPARITATLPDGSSRQQQRPVRHLRPHTGSRPAAVGPGAEALEQQQAAEQTVEQRSVTLRKPVGVVFAQNKGGPVFVEEVSSGGNADKSGVVQVSDAIATTATHLVEGAQHPAVA